MAGSKFNLGCWLGFYKCFHIYGGRLAAGNLADRSANFPANFNLDWIIEIWEELLLIAAPIAIGKLLEHER